MNGQILRPKKRHALNNERPPSFHKSTEHGESGVHVASNIDGVTWHTASHGHSPIRTREYMYKGSKGRYRQGILWHLLHRKWQDQRAAPSRQINKQVHFQDTKQAGTYYQNPEYSSGSQMDCPMVQLNAATSICQSFIPEKKIYTSNIAKRGRDRYDVELGAFE